MSPYNFITSVLDYIQNQGLKEKNCIYMNPHEKYKYNVSMIGMLFHKIETSIKMNGFAKKKFQENG